ncbi:hypothetical protein KKI23_01810 [Patescibacteria group bacterium]|nr:hypothetical protein [Patescibacteria group bacterium]
MRIPEAVAKIGKLLPKGVTVSHRQGNFPAVTIICPEAERDQLAAKMVKQFSGVGYTPSVRRPVHNQIIVEVVGDWPMLVEWFQVFAAFERIEAVIPGASCGMITLGERGEYEVQAWLKGAGQEETVTALTEILPEVVGSDDFQIEVRKDHLTLKVPKWSMMAEVMERVAPSIG